MSPNLTSYFSFHLGIIPIDIKPEQLGTNGVSQLPAKAIPLKDAGKLKKATGPKGHVVRKFLSRWRRDEIEEQEGGTLTRCPRCSLLRKPLCLQGF
jgi:hypothetical protein